MKLRKSRVGRKGRIEIIPMIDVMFFLLATFMLASLALQNLHSLSVDLPRGEAEPLQQTQRVTLAVSSEGAITINEQPVTLDTLGQVLQPLLAVARGTVVVAADNRAPNGVVVQAMLRARAAGAEHFAIAVRKE